MPLTAPRVSVVMVTYNVDAFVAAAIDSVLSQEGVDFELIVGDDESTDRTWQIVTGMAARDERIRAFQRPHTGKPSVIRNAALRQASGTHIAFLDGDDIYCAKRLRSVIDMFDREPGTDVVFHDVQRMAEDGTLRESTYLTESTFLSRSASYWKRIDGTTYFAGPRFPAFTSAIFCGIHTSSITITAERLRREETWFPEDLVIGEDLDLWYRLVTGSSTVFIDQVLSAYRERGSSLTRDRRSFHAGTIEADLRNLARVDSQLTRDERAYYIRRISRRYRFLAGEQERALDRSSARTSCYRSFRLEPNLPAVTLYVKTLVPRPLLTLARRFSRSA